MIEPENQYKTSITAKKYAVIIFKTGNDVKNNLKNLIVNQKIDKEIKIFVFYTYIHLVIHNNYG